MKMFKKSGLLSVLVVLALVSVVSVASTAFAQTIPALSKQAIFTVGLKTVVVDGNTYTMDVAPYIDSNGRTMIPVRYLADVLGMTTTWDSEDQTVILSNQPLGITEILTVGSDQISVRSRSEDKIITMNSAPVVIPPGRTMLPLRYVAQALGCSVQWNPSNKAITVISNSTSSPGATASGNTAPKVIPVPNTGTVGSTSNTLPSSRLKPTIFD